jgi:hypothetical protein
MNRKRKEEVENQKEKIDYKNIYRMPKKDDPTTR